MFLWMIIWTFAQSLAALVILKACLVEELEEGIRGYGGRFLDEYSSDGFDLFGALVGRAFVLFALLGWVGGSILGVYIYPGQDWWMVGVGVALGVGICAALVIILPVAGFWIVVWAWRGLKYLLPKRKARKKQAVSHL